MEPELASVTLNGRAVLATYNLMREEKANQDGRWKYDVKWSSNFSSTCYQKGRILGGIFDRQGG